MFIYIERHSIVLRPADPLEEAYIADVLGLDEFGHHMYAVLEKSTYGTPQIRIQKELPELASS